ncbi:MAG: site-2 protease family protein [Candidatus Omnitrophota bacterium]
MDISFVSIVFTFPLFILAVMIHEVAHGWAAYKLGDSTAKDRGRISLNPFVHIDPVGTIILPLSLVFFNSPVVFGWAKPVPINFFNLRNPKSGIILVGLAGPAANLILAFILAVLYFLFQGTHCLLFDQIIFYSILANSILALFNLIPIPPLDGSRILFGLLPPKLAVRYIKIEKYGFILLFILLWLGFIDWLINPVIQAISGIIGIPV